MAGIDSLPPPSPLFLRGWNSAGRPLKEPELLVRDFVMTGPPQPEMLVFSTIGFLKGWQSLSTSLRLI